MPNIEIEIEGIIALLFRKGITGITECFMGIVNNVPQHELEIKCKKNTVVVPINPANITELILDVQNTQVAGIRLFNLQNIDRVTGQMVTNAGETLPADPQSASWILEFEGELYRSDDGENGKIGVDPTKFRPIFRVNNGEIFSQQLSVNHLLCRREEEEENGEPFTLVGRVATVVGIRIDLDTPESRAQLSNVSTPIVDVLPADKLELRVALVCPSCSHTGQETGHANHYYRALGKKLGFGRKKKFSSTKIPNPGVSGPPISPEASCLVGRASKSDPGG